MLFRAKETLIIAEIGKGAAVTCCKQLLSKFNLIPFDLGPGQTRSLLLKTGMIRCVGNVAEAKDSKSS